MDVIIEISKKGEMVIIPKTFTICIKRAETRRVIKIYVLIYIIKNITIWFSVIRVINTGSNIYYKKYKYLVLHY